MDIFPVYYFPPISWFAAFAVRETVLLEQHQHYRKQNFYNRTEIKGPNKTLLLTVPVVRDHENTPMHARRISYVENWVKDHWKSLETAYRATPYFEFYEDRLYPIFEAPGERLLDLNLRILELLTGLLGLGTQWELSERYAAPDTYENDFRSAFRRGEAHRPKWFEPVPYRQLYGGFTPDLSILDLLCNMGPESAAILRQCYRS